MAEENKKKQQSNSINSVAKGLNKDFSRQSQPEGTYRFALNAVAESKEGNHGFLINEEGNYQCVELEDNSWIPIGHVYLDNDTALVFLYNTNPLFQNYGRIIKIKRDCTLEIYLTSDCFNFRPTHQIDAEYRVRNGCEIVVYFTDDYNDIRAINIDSLDNYLKPGAVYDPEDATIWDCETFKFFPDYTMPQIEFDSMNEGGDLKAGVYQFSFRYLDQDGNPTNWFPITQPIPVIEDPLTNIEFDMKGEYTGTTTRKAINFSFTNLDTSFNFLEVAVIPSTVGTGEINGPVYITDKVPIVTSTAFYTFNTLDTSSATITTLEDLIIDRIVYSRAKTIEQLQNRLIIGNLRGAEKLFDWGKFQIAANSTRIQYITKACSTEDANGDSVQSGEYYFDFRTFMRDEVYALAVVWVFKDGTRSPAFHIPGREKDKYSDGSAIPAGEDENNPTTPGAPAAYSMAETHRLLPTIGFDSSVIVQNTDDPNIKHYDVDPISGVIERWEVYNTAIRTSQGLVSGEWVTEGDPGYYESRQYRYPNTLDCDGNPLYPVESGTGTPVDPYIMDKVRHHRMPDTSLEQHFYGDKSITYGDMFPVAAAASGNQPYGAGNPRVISLGIKATITPPTEYERDVQGFYIVRARRQNQDKSVLDKGIAFFNHEGYVGYKGSNSNGVDIDNCHFMFQGGQGNKQLTDAACVHWTWDNVSGGDPEDYPINDEDIAGAVPGYDLENTSNLAPNSWLPLGDLIQCNQCWQGTGALAKQFANSLINQEDWQFTGAPVAPTNTYDNNADFGNGYPISFDESNVGESFDALVTPLTNIAYHGPMSKFYSVESPVYMKFERILTGYTAAVICASACCDNDEGAQAALNYQGFGSINEDRHDGHTTFILTKYSYQQSALPYTKIDTGMNNATGQPGFVNGTPNIAWNHIINFSPSQYTYPLYNVSIQDSVKLGLDSVISVSTFHDVFDNFQAQEALALQTKIIGTTESPLQFKIPYPGNNAGYTAIEDDMTFGRAWCSDFISSPWNPAGDQGRATAYYIALKKNSYDAFGDISSLEYQSTDTNITYINPNPSTPVVTGGLFGGDSFVSRFAFRRTQWAKRCGKTIVPSTAFGGTPDLSTNNCADIGDPNVDREPFPDNATGPDVAECDDNNRNGQNRALLNNNIIWYWTESFINTEFRNGRDTITERFYPYFFEGTSLLGPYSFIDSENVYDSNLASPDNDGELETSVIKQENYYNINSDYIKENTENVYYPLGLLFDFCSDCHEDFPHRIAYSTQSFQETQTDNYRTFLANNYRDIPGNRGEIWNLFTLNNALYIQTEESLWKVLPSTQATALEDTTVYIGTGEFFSNPPLEILESETGYMGSQSQWATLVSENGMFWPDARQGKVFAFNNQPEDYSIKGLKNWFEDNMRMEIYDQYLEIFGIPFPGIDAPAAPQGAGYLGVYDARHSRYILTKKDYLLRAPFNTTDPADPFYQRISFNETYGVWQVFQWSLDDCLCYQHQWINDEAGAPVFPVIDPVTHECVYTWIDPAGLGITREYREPCNGKFASDWRDKYGKGPCIKNNDISLAPIVIYEGDEPLYTITDWDQVFECKSWTISYSMLGSSWTSWHSYMPSYYIGTKNFFWSSINLFSFLDPTTPPSLGWIPSHFWRHELTDLRDNYQTYYSEIRPHIIELISNESPLQVTIQDYYHFLTDAYTYDPATKDYLEMRYITFDKAYLYNSFQNTNVLTLVVKDSNIATMASQSVIELANRAIIDRKERVWRMNQFNDFAINRNTVSPPTLFITDWADPTYLAEYYIDRVVNPLAVGSYLPANPDYKNWFNRQPMRDKYLGIRLFFSNLDGDHNGKIKLVTNYIFSQSTTSPR